MPARRTVANLVDMLDWTSQGLNRFAPQAPALVAPFDPRMPLAFVANSANEAFATRVVIPRTGTLRDIAALIGASSGNLDVGVYDTNGATRARLYSSGSIASPGTGWQILANPNLAVTAGDQLDLVIAADNATVTFGRLILATTAQSQLPADFWPTSGGAAPKLAWSRGASFPLPASITEASMAASSRAFCIIARVA